MQLEAYKVGSKEVHIPQLHRFKTACVDFAGESSDFVCIAFVLFRESALGTIVQRVVLLETITSGVFGLVSVKPPWPTGAQG